MNTFITLSRLVTKRFIALFITIIMFYQCTLPEKKKSESIEYRNTISEKLYNVRNEDSLLTILQQYSEEENDLGKAICYKNLGALQRAEGRFSEAISNHTKGLTIALNLNDTIEIVQAMNSMGVNYQRLGACSEAFQYHYQALSYAENWSELHTPIGMKNQIASLNGIGNISLNLGYYSDAEKIFREVLEYQIPEDIRHEQSVTYANLGHVFLIYQQYDSAYTCYQKSMELKSIANSNKGRGICLMNFGKLYEKENKYDLAKAVYSKAYELMDQTSNKYNWLEACLSMARINLTTSNHSEFTNYIQLAEDTAHEINSLDYLAEVYKLKYNYNIKQGNTQFALQNLTKHIAMQDSVQRIQKANLYMETRLRYVQDKNELRLQQVEAANMMKHQKKEYVIYMSWVITIFSLIILAAVYYAYKIRTRSNKTLKKLETARSDFYTNITHEFRTPLTVIQGMNRHIHEKTNISEKEKSVFSESIERQTNNLLNLVNQLLDVARLKKGADDPQWKRGNIIAYLAMSAESFRLYAAEKGVNLIFYSEIVASEMDFIPSYIDKIVANLLSNAIKHTDGGDKINFTVAQGKKSGTITIRISDMGEGIPEKDLAHIFDLFYRSPQAKDKSGTGIGLAFTKMMIEKMKGKIEVESELGKGTVFTIILPLKNKKLPHIDPLNVNEKQITNPTRELTNDVKNKAENFRDESNVSKPLILIVEDNSDILLYIKSILTEKYRIITAWNGEEGMNKAKEHIPDMIITDLMMPVKDGYQFVGELKQDRLLNHIPVIMLTAKATEEDRIKGLRYGVDGYIHKPFQHEELLIRIENIFENRRVLKERYMNAITHRGSENKVTDDENMKFLQTINNIIYAELNNPELNSVFLADKMAMSISQLSRKINGITGYATISYVLRLKLNKAKTMLEDENISITEVSDACGFYYVSYFSRAFKKEYGLSPSEYKNNFQSKLK